MQISVRCKNTGTTKQVEKGISLLELYNVFSPIEIAKPLCATINNEVTELTAVVYDNSDVQFFGLNSSLGMRTYTSSVQFMLCKAIKELHPDCSITMEASVSNGYYYILYKDEKEFKPDCDALSAKMQEYVDADIPFEKVTALAEDAIPLFESKGAKTAVKMVSSLKRLYVKYFRLGDYFDFNYNVMLPSTGYIDNFAVVPYHKGLLVRMPQGDNPKELKPMMCQDKMLDIFIEHHKWQKIIGLKTIADLNECIDKGYSNELIIISEALQEKKIASIAENIKNRETVKLVLIAGPSSSGKTTFCKRLSVQLLACGLRPLPISMDDYFVDREHTPRDENGEYDFESIDALNLPLLEEHLKSLFAGEEIELPRFDFTTGKSSPSGKKLRMCSNDVIVMEGIHALNPKLTVGLSSELKYKIYASALTTILLDNHNHISTHDNRLLRRIVRDYKYRHYSAEETISRWSSVTKGEDKWIFPFQEEADVMFNSALLFEFAGLCSQALPILESVPQSVPEYAEARRLMKFLKYVRPIDITRLPPTSLLLEFLGGSSFKY
ncbi:MAG: nucleoside kinase [Prevotellaceae bacterium]|nr:nucleoside kinase [Candidatus Faecinaster equi]